MNSYYQWTRDSAMVFKVLLNSYLNGNSSLDTFLREYVTESDKLQRTSNPSGSYQGAGIGLSPPHSHFDFLQIDLLFR